MEVVNLLDFLNKAKDIHALDYAACNEVLVNFLDFMTEDEQFTQKISLGVMFVKQRTSDQYTIVDGLARILSLSLLLHAICECYKKTTIKNEKAIKTIRNKYLITESHTKLHLPAEEQIIYEKIINGERLSGKEKSSPIFKLLHNFWTQIKEEDLYASNIFKMLQKVFVIMDETDNVPQRDLYFELNKHKKNINQLLLIKNYLKNIGIESEWNKIVDIYNNNSADINLFFKDFFVTRFNFKEYTNKRLYETFVNYFETMLQYLPEDTVMAKLSRSAAIYNNILNINIKNDLIKKALIQIKIHKGEDTYAYILNIYEDYLDNNISEVTLLEILSTIDEYLRNRIKTPNDIAFNELIKYLNAFITCK